LDDYYKLFRLTSAVINISYIGQIELASGFLVGSLEYGVHPVLNADLTASGVEDGFNLQRTMNLTDGLRMLWFPMDITDQAFSDATTGISDSREAILIYGTGLPIEGNFQLRVDIERHFEGIPVQKARDFIATARGHSSPGAMKTLRAISAKTPRLLSLKPKEVAKVHNAVAGNLSWIDEIVDRLGDFGRQVFGQFTNSLSRDYTRAMIGEGGEGSFSNVDLSTAIAAGLTKFLGR
jgi:hypothetical protein